MVTSLILAVLKVLIAPFFLNLRNFETKEDTSEKHGLKSTYLQEIYHHDSGWYVDFFPVQS